MEKINVAEMLKDCPQGMELDCTMYDSVTLLNVDNRKDMIFPIRVVRGDGNSMSLTKYGQFTDADFAKCIIFPKGKTTWEGFVPSIEFKNGDIIYVKDKHKQEWCSIIKNCKDGKLHDYVDICINSNSLYYDKPNILCCYKDIIEYRLATEKEKEKLFWAIKERGYKWNAETKTLEKLIKPKFKVGDRIVNKDGVCIPILITKVSDEYYYSNTENSATVLSISAQDNWELVPNKFDINTLKPFESKVLVRNEYRVLTGENYWRAAVYGGFIKDLWHQFHVVGGNFFKCCIPYEGNEHLLNKTDDCDEYFKTWK